MNLAAPVNYFDMFTKQMSHKLKTKVPEVEIAH